MEKDIFFIKDPGSENSFIYNTVLTVLTVWNSVNILRRVRIKMQPCNKVRALHTGVLLLRLFSSSPLLTDLTRK